MIRRAGEPGPAGRRGLARPGSDRVGGSGLSPPVTCQLRPHGAGSGRAHSITVRPGTVPPYYIRYAGTVTTPTAAAGRTQAAPSVTPIRSDPGP
eukprot:753129-Hanusia_phi.AAC.2